MSKHIIKRFLCIFLVIIIVFTSAASKKYEVKAVAITTGVVVGGSTLFSLLCTGLIVSGVYEVATDDSYLEVDEAMQAEIVAQQEQEMRDFIKANYLANYDASNPTEFQQICIAAVFGTDGTSALQDFSEKNDLRSQLRIYNGGKNNKFDPLGNKYASIAVSGHFMNRIQEILRTNASSEDVENKNNTLGLPDFDHLSDMENYIIYGPSDAPRLSFFNGDVWVGSNVTDTYGLHGSSSGQHSVYIYRDYKGYSLNGNRQGEHLEFTINNKQTLFYWNMDIFDENGILVYPANPFKNNSGNINKPAGINVGDSYTAPPPASDSSVNWNDNDKLLFNNDSATNILDEINTLEIIEPTDNPELKPTIPERTKQAAINNTQNNVNNDLNLDENYNFNTNPFPDSEAAPVIPDHSLDDMVSDGLSDKFPFCIPFDLIHAVEYLVATPAPPKWIFPFKVERIGIDEEIVLDFSKFDGVAAACRLLETFGFLVFLIMKTRNLIKG